MSRMIANGGDHQNAYVLAFDQGTTNSKALLIDAATGAVVRKSVKPVGVQHIGPDRVEQDGEKIWSSIVSAAAECLEQVPSSRLRGITISSQRESVAVWDAKTGHLLGPVIGWQDSRTVEECRRLASSADRVRALTGLELDPMYSASKMRWLVNNSDLKKDANIHIGTIDTFLLERLTGNHLTEPGNASRTLLFDIEMGVWSEELCDLFDVPSALLPQVVSSQGDFGVTRRGLPIPSGVPILAVLADSHAALYLHSRGREQIAKATYGTGTSVMAVIPKPDAASSVASTIAWANPDPVYAAEGNILASGAALELMARLITDGDITLLGELAAKATSSGGVSFVPALSGLGAPYFDRSASGIIDGINGGISKGLLARAAFEAVVHQVADVVEAFESQGTVEIEQLYADGGASSSRFLMELQALVLQRPVLISSIEEASALGTALFACHSHQLAEPTAWRLEPPTIIDLPQSDSQVSRRQWRRAVDRSRGRSILAEDDY